MCHLQITIKFVGVRRLVLEDYLQQTAPCYRTIESPLCQCGGTKTSNNTEVSEKQGEVYSLFIINKFELIVGFIGAPSTPAPGVIRPPPP